MEQGGPTLIITRGGRISAPPPRWPAACRPLLPLCRHLLPGLDMVSSGGMADPERGSGSGARAPMLRCGQRHRAKARVTSPPSGTLGCRYGRWRWWRPGETGAWPVSTPGPVCWRVPAAGCGRKADLRGTVLALLVSWSLGVPDLAGAQFSLHPSAAPALRPVLAPSWDSVSHLGAEVGQDLRSFGKGCPWSC